MWQWVFGTGMSGLSRSGARVLRAWMAVVCAAPGWVFALALLLAVIAAGSAAMTLEVNTSSKDMLSEDLPYRRNSLALEAAFPDLKADLLVIIESDEPARARRAAKALTAISNWGQIEMTRSRGGAFFERARSALR